VIGIEAFSEASDASRSARALRLRPQSASASACELGGASQDMSRCAGGYESAPKMRMLLARFSSAFFARCVMG
jgi:hypothetical protein